MRKVKQLSRTQTKLLRDITLECLEQGTEIEVRHQNKKTCQQV